MKQREEYLKIAIADISERLKGPMDNLERALLVADRKDFREELAKLEHAQLEH